MNTDKSNDADDQRNGPDQPNDDDQSDNGVEDECNETLEESTLKKRIFDRFKKQAEKDATERVVDRFLDKIESAVDKAQNIDLSDAAEKGKEAIQEILNNGGGMLRSNMPVPDATAIIDVTLIDVEDENS